MPETTPSPMRTGPPRADERRFLTEQKLRESAELMFFAYRGFTRDPDRILANWNYGRAHHRALHFIGRQPGISVAGLLGILDITKQSLARVLKPLIDGGLVESRMGEDDRRMRLLFLTEKGAAFEEELSSAQRERLMHAFREAGAEAVAGFRRVLTLMVDEADRDQMERGREARLGSVE